jgi:hypothetical protein
MLPLLLAVSVFFISQGISVPNFSNPREARLSRSREVKPRAVVVVKDQVKSPQSRIVKTAQFLDFCGNVGVRNNPSERGVTFHHGYSPVISVSDAAIPARAPPA